MSLWKTITRETLGKPNKFMTVELHTVELPDGRRISDWGWLILPDYVNMLARDEQGRFLLFRQFKYAVSETTLAMPGGFIEPGEEPLAAAQRELLEETGYAARQWFSLGSYVMDANRGAGHGHFFLAMEAYHVSAPTEGDLEEQQLVFISQTELEAFLDAGNFKAIPWATVAALGLRRLAKEIKTC